MACGLRFLGLDSKIADIADLYGMSISSCRRVIDMFFDAIDHNSQCRELQIERLFRDYIITSVVIMIEWHVI